eukprot:13594969-Heterocapsa_arctica.AAC.1
MRFLAGLRATASRWSTAWLASPWLCACVLPSTCMPKALQISPGSAGSACLPVRGLFRPDVKGLPSLKSSNLV